MKVELNLKNQSCDCNDKLDLPSAFIIHEPYLFGVKDKLTDGDIINAAKSILTHQLQIFSNVLSQSSKVKDLALLTLTNEKVESFCVMFMDTQLRLICFETMFQGTINSVGVYPREIAKRAFELNAGAVVLVHNHPSGCYEPSISDERLTDELKVAFKLLEIQIIDHLIVAGKNVYSFAENGKL